MSGCVRLGRGTWVLGWHMLYDGDRCYWTASDAAESGRARLARKAPTMADSCSASVAPWAR